MPQVQYAAFSTPKGADIRWPIAHGLLITASLLVTPPLIVTGREGAYAYFGGAIGIGYVGLRVPAVRHRSRARRNGWRDYQG